MTSESFFWSLSFRNLSSVFKYYHCYIMTTLWYDRILIIEFYQVIWVPTHQKFGWWWILIFDWLKSARMEWNHVVRIDHRNYFSEVRRGWTLNRFNILEAVLIRWSYFSQLDHYRPPNAFLGIKNYQMTVMINNNIFIKLFYNAA